MLKIGETIDRFRVEALVGQGGMAAVYRARHTQLDSEHAIKVLFITAPSVRKRLLLEGRVQANLRHPNIVSVTDVLDVHGAPALVMEYVDGPSLDDWLQEHRPTLDEALWLFRGILKGIDAAHERGVVHRDLKPANVLLAPTNDGLTPKVTDFGLVKSIVAQEGHTKSGMALGTPEYMGPEQIRDARDVDQRADMWALGCILYELVCGVRAFSGPDRMSIFHRVVAGAYDPPGDHVEELPTRVEEAIRRLLEGDPEKRLRTTAELVELLYQDGTPPGQIAAPKRSTTPLLVDIPDSFEGGPGDPAGQTLVPDLNYRLQKELGDARTAEPATRRRSSVPGMPRPSSRATAEFPAFRPRPRGWGLTVVGPVLIALVVGLGLWGGARLLSGSDPAGEGVPTVAPTASGDGAGITPRPTEATAEPGSAGEPGAEAAHTTGGAGAEEGPSGGALGAGGAPEAVASGGSAEPGAQEARGADGAGGSDEADGAGEAGEAGEADEAGGGDEASEGAAEFDGSSSGGGTEAVAEDDGRAGAGSADEVSGAGAPADPGAPEPGAPDPARAGAESAGGAASGEPSASDASPTMPAPAVLARVDIEGDADAVWLEDLVSGERYEPGRPIKPGRYKILASFSGDELVGAGSVELASGERVVLQCSSFLMQCKHKGQ